MIDKFRRKLNRLINETLSEGNNQKDLGDQIEIEMIRMCSITNISNVLREKQIAVNKELDRINEPK